MNFVKSNLIGGQGEAKVITTLQCAGMEAVKNQDKDTRGHHDLICKVDNEEFTIEVKFDAYCQKSGNLAIEYFNPRANKPSGIYSTKADIWAHVIADDTNLTVWICNTKVLRKYVKETAPFRICKGVGDGNADILLFKADDMLEQTFTRLDNVSNEEVKKRVKKCLN